MNRYILPLIGADWLGSPLSTSAHAIPIQCDRPSLGGRDCHYDHPISNHGSFGADVSVDLNLNLNLNPALYLKSSLNIATSSPTAPNCEQLIRSPAPC